MSFKILRYQYKIIPSKNATATAKQNKITNHFKILSFKTFFENSFLYCASFSSKYCAEIWYLFIFSALKSLYLSLSSCLKSVKYLKISHTPQNKANKRRVQSTKYTKPAQSFPNNAKMIAKTTATAVMI